MSDVFDEYLDEIYDDVFIFDVRYTASQILKECDPTAYRMYESDWESEQEEDDDDDQDSEDTDQDLVDVHDHRVPSGGLF